MARKGVGGIVNQHNLGSFHDWEEMACLLQEGMEQGEVRLNEPMRSHTSFRVGGPADVFVRPHGIDELRTALRICYRCGVSPLIIGNGTNLLVSDAGIRGVVIQIGDNLADILVSGQTITAQAGVSLAKLAATALGHSLAGLEFASGIPGTLGGAVAMNAGAYGGEMKDIVTEVVCFDLAANQKLLGRDQLEFGYRTSIIQREGYVVAEVTMQLSPGNPEGIKGLMTDLNARRRAKQPLHLPSAGSVFKRPPGYFAGKLIEDAGLKGYRIGDAQVSELHCGFIVNLGEATASDILRLIRHVQSEVKRQFGVHLETEVRIVGDWTNTQKEQ